MARDAVVLEAFRTYQKPLVNRGTAIGLSASGVSDLVFEGLDLTRDQQS
jgi:hypothetical protein